MTFPANFRRFSFSKQAKIQLECPSNLFFGLCCNLIRKHENCIHLFWFIGFTRAVRLNWINQCQCIYVSRNAKVRNSFICCSSQNKCGLITFLYFCAKADSLCFGTAFGGSKRNHSNRTYCECSLNQQPIPTGNRISSCLLRLYGSVNSH